ncbi:MAG TPA: PHP domain-containing protein, partial [Armatimonadetes bacterium]|nr:PHP domain-containing protein [Armatimonadota bacterium]
AALEGRLPKLIELPDIKGDLHVHTKWTDGGHTIEEMARKAKELGYEYLGVCDHSKAMTFVHGLDERRLLEQVKEIRALNERLKGIRVLTGVEVDILPDGSLDLAEEVLDQVDIVVASVHSKFKMKEAEMTERIIRAMRKRCVDIIGHPTGRIIGEREPYEVDFDKLLEVAAETKTALEINAFPERLDLKDVHARAAKERGVMLAINTDAHSVFQLEWIIFGVAVARRGWVEPQDVLNTKPLEELLEWLHHRYD